MATSKNMEQQNLEFQRITIKTLAQIHKKLCELDACEYSDPAARTIMSQFDNLINLDAATINTQEKIIGLLQGHQRLLVENSRDNQRIKQSLYYLTIAIKQLSDKFDMLMND